jgi:hypothetical protein
VGYTRRSVVTRCSSMSHNRDRCVLSPPRALICPNSNRCSLFFFSLFSSDPTNQDLSSCSYSSFISLTDPRVLRSHSPPLPLQVFSCCNSMSKDPSGDLPSLFARSHSFALLGCPTRLPESLDNTVRRVSLSLS